MKSELGTSDDCNVSITGIIKLQIIPVNQDIDGELVYADPSNMKLSQSVSPSRQLSNLQRNSTLSQM